MFWFLSNLSLSQKNFIFLCHKMQKPQHVMCTNLFKRNSLIQLQNADPAQMSFVKLLQQESMESFGFIFNS